MTQRAAADEDAADIRRVLDGDVSAFSGIVQRWQDRLMSLAWRFCHDRTLAEDMAQEAFVKAFRALGTFRGEATFSTWLTAIAMNTYRSCLREREPVVAGLDHAMLAADQPDALAGLQQLERAAWVRRAVRTLPRRYREAIVLFYFEQMDLAETARVLGIPQGTLKARLHRGRELLKIRAAARLSMLVPDRETI